MLSSNWSSIIAQPLSESKTDKSLPQSKLGRKGENIVQQFVVPGFDDLPLERKLFVYNLSQAIDAGRDIYWQQKSPEGLAIRALFERLWRYQNLYGRRTRTAIEAYLFRLYKNKGNYDASQNTKFTLNITRKAFRNAVRVAQREESKKDKKARETKSLTAEANRLVKDIIDPQFRRIFIADADADGVIDPIRDSQSRFYGPGVTKVVLDALPPELRNHFLSFPVRKDNGSVELEPIKVDGKYGEQLLAIDYHLDLASQFGNEQEKEIISAYRRALDTGNPQDLAKAEILWTQYKPQDIDFQIGFIEVYSDPIQVRGAWTGMILLLRNDPDEKARTDAVIANAAEFEEKMPVDQRFKNLGPSRTAVPQARSVNMLYGGGEGGEGAFRGVNLPNSADISERYGSKSYGVFNVQEDLVGDRIAPTELDKIRPFFHSKYHKWFRPDFLALSELKTDFHEILGHGAGKLLPGVEATALEELVNPVEECRAETASLYHLTDYQFLMEKGILPSSFSAQDAEQFVELEIIRFFTRQVNLYRKLADDTTSIKQAHNWARQVMLNKMIRDGALIVGSNMSQSGFPKFRLKSIDAARTSLGELWGTLQELRSTGDVEGARQLSKDLAFYNDTHRAWRSHSIRINDSLNIPKHALYLNPRFELVRQGDRLTDVRLVYHRKNTPVKTAVDRLTEEYRRAQANVQQFASVACDVMSAFAPL